METEQCNGWANRETWLVKLWIDNDKQSQLYWQKVARDLRASKGITDALPAIARCLERTIKDQAPKVAHGMYADLMSTGLSRIAWFEIATAMLDDLDQIEPEDGFVLIHAYTRAQAIADGVLIDVSKLAKEAGFRFPVALTSAAWADCVAVPEGAEDQDETGRLWDVLNVLHFAIKTSPKNRNSSEIRFKVSVRTGEATSEDIELKSVCGPGDDPAPVITVMLPHED